MLSLGLQDCGSFGFAYVTAEVPLSGGEDWEQSLRWLASAGETVAFLSAGASIVSRALSGSCC